MATEAEKAKKLEEYLVIWMAKRKDECEKKSDNDVKELAMKHSTAKSSGNLIVFILVNFLSFFSM